MHDSETRSDHDVLADINYFSATGKVIETSVWKPRYLGVGDRFTRKMTIRDIRGIEQRFSLNENGFEFVKLPNRLRPVDDDGTIKTEYYSELEELVKNMTGASTVYVFNHVIRRCNNIADKGKLDASGRWQVLPSGHPHVDYSGIPEHIEGTFRELSLPDSITKHLNLINGPRFCFLGLWRPLTTLIKDPLAVADATTVPDSDYQIRARKFQPSGNTSGNYVMSHGNGKSQHKWYYMHEMQPNELVVFKGFDTKQDLPGWRCPHTAFVLPDTEDMPPRESIEARAVAIWD